MNKSQIDAVILAVAELPDRDSPEDQPEMMLVSADELREILEEQLAAPSRRRSQRRARASLTIRWTCSPIRIRRTVAATAPVAWRTSHNGYKVKSDVFESQRTTRGNKMTREQAIELARIHAKAQPQSYYSEPFQPHEWVIAAILAAAPAEPTEIMLMAGMHATTPVKLETYQVAQVYKAMMGVALNVTNPDQDTCDPQQGLLNPANQVYFRAGLLACREYMARFVESENAGIAASIRANWWPGLGKDFGAPRKLEWDELTIGEYGEASFRARTTEEVSPTLEALPIALGFLGQKVNRELS